MRTVGQNLALALRNAAAKRTLAACGKLTPMFHISSRRSIAQLTKRLKPDA